MIRQRIRHRSRQTACRRRSLTPRQLEEGRGGEHPRGGSHYSRISLWGQSTDSVRRLIRAPAVSDDPLPGGSRGQLGHNPSRSLVNGAMFFRAPHLTSQLESPRGKPHPVRRHRCAWLPGAQCDSLVGSSTSVRPSRSSARWPSLPLFLPPTGACCAAAPYPPRATPTPCKSCRSAGSSPDA